MQIRILLADDHTMFREGLRVLLQKQPDMIVDGDVGDGQEAVDMTRDKHPDVVLMDVSMPGMNGVEATRRIKNECPSAKVLCLSMYTGNHFVSAMLGAGASGYLPKDCETEELIRAIRTVATDRTYLSAEVAGNVVKEYVRHGREGETNPTSMLTPRECEVLQLLVDGMSARSIADKLAVSVKTVHTHRERIMRKLDVGSIAELTKYALRQKLTQP